MSKRHRVYLWMGSLIFFSWLSLAFMDTDPAGNNHIPLGYFFGSLFAHATLAAAWAALGPGTVASRVVLSIAWVISLPVAIGINVSLNGGPNDGAFTLGGCLIAQWVMLQLPLWALAATMRLELRHKEDLQSDEVHRLRFGIRHLLIVMAIVSVLLGVGRLVVPHINISGQGELPIFFFMVVAAIVLLLPLLLAALMRRLALPGVLLALLLVGIATAWELPLLQQLGSGGPDAEHFIAINVASSAFILICALVVRFNGYRLDMRPRSTLSESKEPVC